MKSGEDADPSRYEPNLRVTKYGNEVRLFIDGIQYDLSDLEIDFGYDQFRNITFLQTVTLTNSKMKTMYISQNFRISAFRRSTYFPNDKSYEMSPGNLHDI